MYVFVGFVELIKIIHFNYSNIQWYSDLVSKITIAHF